ncbi:hypothetical protein MUA04_23375 [Enterobacteriaceae bacterium H11S18]|nr:hypothetical protein [Dryocola clanedunensis]
MSCTTDPDSDSCKKGLAMQNALMVALPAGLGGGVLAAATPEIAAAAQAAIQSCTGNVVLCLMRSAEAPPVTLKVMIH